MTLAEFVLARIAEDEAYARRASKGPWREANEGAPGDRDAYTIRDAAGWALGEDPGHFSATDAEHIARHDPARVLAECEAKRKVIRICESYADEWGDYSQDIYQAMALPYADHPDYDEAWKP